MKSSIVLLLCSFAFCVGATPLVSTIPDGDKTVKTFDSHSVDQDYSFEATSVTSLDVPSTIVYEYKSSNVYGVDVFLASEVLNPSFNRPIMIYTLGGLCLVYYSKIEINCNSPPNV